MTAQIALQIIIGLIFFFTGTIKLITAKEKLPSKGVSGFEHIAPLLIKCLALAELIGALTLLVFSIPSLPQSPIKFATVSFSLLMIAASYHHLKRKEPKNAVVAAILFLICLVILFLK